MTKFHLAWFGNQSPSGWRKPSGQLFDWRQADIYLETARLCERAKFDMVLFADSLAVPAVLGGSRDWSVAHGHHVAMDPAPTIAMMGAVTQHIGLGCTLSSTFYPPFLLARLLSTLDHLTRGRIMWNLVTTASKDAAQNFGLDDILEHDARYDRADEYVALCRALWDSWEPDAVVMDREANLFADPAKVHAVDFEGEHFRCKGPSTVTSSPQRHPVISVAGTSPRGQRFAVQHGDMAISHKNSIEDMRDYVQTTRAQLEAAGRDPKSVKIFFSIKPVMGDTEAEAQERWAKNLADADVDAGLATLATFMGIDLLPSTWTSPCRATCMCRACAAPSSATCHCRRAPRCAIGPAWKASTRRIRSAAPRPTSPMCWNILSSIPAATGSTSARRGGSPTSNICWRSRPS